MYRVYRVLTLLAFAYALNGCGGLAVRPASGMPEPPAWNSLELIWTNTEVVSIEASKSNLPVES